MGYGYSMAGPAAHSPCAPAQYQAHEKALQRMFTEPENEAEH